MASEGHDKSTVLSHLLQLDHWTFLLGLALISVNVVVNRRLLSAVATVLLLVALVYDVYEFYRAE